MRTQIQNAICQNGDYYETRCAKGYYVPEDDSLRVLIEKTYEVVSGVCDAKSTKTPAGTHDKYLKNALPIGTVGYYKANPIDLPESHGGVHQPDEKLNVDGFLEAIKILGMYNYGN